MKKTLLILSLLAIAGAWLIVKQGSETQESENAESLFI